MKVKMIGLNNVIECAVSVIDTDSYESEWCNYTVQIRSQFTDCHAFIDEYKFIDESGVTICGIKTTNRYGEEYSYGPAADLIKRFCLRNARTIDLEL